MHALTSQIAQALRAPFAPNTIKWKVQTNPKEGKDMALVVAYIDARDVAERLDMAAGGNWSDDYTLPQRAPHERTLECRLTVCGVTRCDVGEVEGGDGWSAKDLYSDAFKRAAVKFGVGAFLYRMPTVRARVEQFGKTWALTKESATELEILTAAILAGKAPPRLTSLFVIGSYQGPEIATPPARPTQASTGASFTPTTTTNGRQDVVAEELAAELFSDDDPNAEPDPNLCPEHGARYRYRGGVKNGKAWGRWSCPVKTDDQWCAQGRWATAEELAMEAAA